MCTCNDYTGCDNCGDCCKGSAKAPHTIRDLARNCPAGYQQWWERKSQDERREIVQNDVDTLSGYFTPSPEVLIWLLETAGVKVS